MSDTYIGCHFIYVTATIFDQYNLCILEWQTVWKYKMSPDIGYSCYEDGSIYYCIQKWYIDERVRFAEWSRHALYFRDKRQSLKYYGHRVFSKSLDFVFCSCKRIGQRLFNDAGTETNKTYITIDYTTYMKLLLTVECISPPLSISAFRSTNWVETFI